MTAHIPFVGTANYPVRTGNDVRLLVDGVPAFRRLSDAIETAEHSVWATIAFMWSTFAMPDGKGTALDVLDRAAARGIDVRVVFWRPGADMAHHRRNAFWGSPDHIALLDDRQPRIKIRWDRAAAGFCQHQKSWVRSIYVENQYLETVEVIERLASALRRGVEVIALVPAEPDAATALPARAALGEYENVMMAGIAGLDAGGERTAV